MSPVTPAEREQTDRLREAIGDFACDTPISKGLSVDLRVTAMIQVAAAGASCMPGDQPTNMKWAVECFIRTLAGLLPGLDFHLEISAAGVPPGDVH